MLRECGVTPKPAAVCICDHGRSLHRRERAKSSSWCDGGSYPGCGCEGWQEPAKPGEPLVFGLSRIPKRNAASAPAWSLDPDE